MIEMKIETCYGEMIACLEFCSDTEFTITVKEKPEVIAEGNSVPEAIKNMQNLLRAVKNYEREKNDKL